MGYRVVIDESQLMVAGVNTRVIPRGVSDRTVLVWTRFHTTETELQRGMRELDRDFSDRGFGTYHFASLRWVEETHERERPQLEDVA